MGVENPYDDSVIKGVGWTTETLKAIKEFVDSLETWLGDPSGHTLTSIVAKLGDNAQTFLAMIGYEGATSLANKLTAARAALLDEITALRMAELDAANIPADIDTLLTRVTAAVALASVCTELRLAELDPANIPADIDTLLTRITAAVALASDLATHEASQVTHRAVLVDIHDTDLPAVKTDTGNIKTQTDKIAGKMLFSMDFWSDSVEEKAVTNAQVTAAVGAAVEVEDLPATATVVRAIIMMKFRMVENTNVAENSLNCDAVQPIQVDNDDNDGWVSGINFVDEQFRIAAETREGGDVIIGKIDVSARVDGNDIYDFQWLNAIAHLPNIQFNDIQMGIRIWYSV